MADRRSEQDNAAVGNAAFLRGWQLRQRMAATQPPATATQTKIAAAARPRLTERSAKEN